MFINAVKKGRMQIVRDIKNGLLFFSKKYLGVLITIAFIIIQKSLPNLGIGFAVSFCVLGLLIAFSIFIGGILPGVLSIAISLVFNLLPQAFITEPLEIYNSFHFKTTFLSIIAMVTFVGAMELKNRKFYNISIENYYNTECIKDIPQLSITHTSINGDFLLSTDKIHASLGYSENEFLSLKIQDVTYNEDMIKEEILIGEMLEGLRSDYNIEKRVLKRDGEIRWVYKSARLIRNEDGTIKHITNYILDITESKIIEEELRQINYKYKKLLQLFPDAIAILDGRTFNYINSSGAKLLGYDNPEALIGKDGTEFIAKADISRVEKSMDWAINNLNIISEPTEFKIASKNGKVFDVETINIGYLCNERLSVMSVARDITERKNAESLKKKMEENLRLLNKAIESDRLKNEFFSNVSHELRTPLNVIMGTLQLLALYKEKGIIDYKNMDRHIKIMKQNCFRLLRLINNLIDSSKIDTGFFKIKLERYDIVKLVEDISLSIVDYIKNNGLELVFDTNMEEKVISCDPNLMERIILNLLANAIKFTDPGGKISVNIKIDDEGEKVNIIIKDTGIGIPEDQFDTIFDRFKQATGPLSQERGGSGIGLSLTKKLVEMHEGSIKVNSKIGEGTEFIISLPMGDDKIPYEKVSKDNRGGNTDKIEIEFSDIYF